MKILVNGCTGTLGSELSQALKEKFSDAEVIEVTHSQLDFSIYPDLLEYMMQEEQNGHIDYVVNCAAVVNTVGIESTFDIRNKSFAANVLIPKYLSAICHKLKSKLIHFSTDFVFSEYSEKAVGGKYDEFPVNIYGCQKLLGEMYIKENMDPSEYSVFRVGWIYGCKTKKSFIHKFLKNAVNVKRTCKKEPPIAKVVSDQVSTPTSVKFIVSGVIEAISTGKMCGIASLCPKGVVTKHAYAVKILENVKSIYGYDWFDNVVVEKAETRQEDIAYPLDSRLEEFDSNDFYQGIKMTWEQDLEMYMKDHEAEFREFIEDLIA